MKPTIVIFKAGNWVDPSEASAGRLISSSEPPYTSACLIEKAKERNLERKFGDFYKFKERKRGGNHYLYLEATDNVFILFTCGEYLKNYTWRSNVKSKMDM
jgi:hypothetical protein